MTETVAASTVRAENAWRLLPVANEGPNGKHRTAPGRLLMPGPHAHAAAADLGAWLAAAGLGHLAPAFEAERIGAAELPDLTDGDLRELGLRIGDRIRLRAALGAAAAASPPPASPLPAPTMAERRPLTVMFVDIVDSTGLSDRLDVEDLIEVVRIYRAFCDAAIRQYGGHVAQFFGDGVMAYFCYPVAHENDAERAVRAGLAIAQGMRTLPTPAGQPVQVRVGVATGRVVISDLFSGASREERKVSGATPNLAARLQALAPPDGVVISELTHELTGALFTCHDAGSHDMRGFGAPQHVFHVVGERPEAAFQPAPHARLTPLFGRETALETLGRRWAQAAAGDGGTALVLGEAGIGKSRLVERFLGTLGPEGAVNVVRVQGGALDRDSPLRPFVAHLRTAAGLAPEDDTETRLQKLAAALRHPGPDDLAVLAELLRIRTDARLAALPPSLLRDRALAALMHQVLGWAEPGPLCLVVEDLHWLDPTSVALLGRVAAAIAGRPAMILATSRDEPDGVRLPDDAGITRIPLARLDPADTASMVQSLFNEPVPAHIAQQIAQRTDGIPLFIEEYIRPLLLAHAGTDWSTLAADDGGIPASLHESLMGRLDRSGPAKAVAQAAAVIGRVARRDLLAAAAGLPPDVLDNALQTLHASGVLHPAAEETGDCWAFGHALLREAAYDSILRDRKRDLHARVAGAMLDIDPEGVELQPELLAAHLTEGGMPGRALDYWVRASERSVRRSSLFEAIALLRRALATTGDLPETPAREASRLKLMALLGPALIAVRGPGSAEAQQLYADAYDLAEAQTASRAHFPLAWGWWRVSRDYVVKQQRAAALLGRARRHSDPEMLLQAHHCNWAAHFERGDFCTCIDHVQAGLAVYQAADYSHHASMYGNHDARVCGHGELSQVFWMQGRLAEAAAEEARSLDWAQRLDHLGSRVHAMDMALLHRSFQRDTAAVRARADRLVAFTAEHGLQDHRAKGLIFTGWATARDGDAAAGLEAIHAGIARQREIGTLEDFPMYVSMLAEAQCAAGEPDRAVEQLRAARAEFDELGLRIWLPEVMRQMSRAILAADPAALRDAEQALDEATAMAEAQRAPMLGLRIALDAARLADARGDPEAAHATLDAAMRRMPAGEHAPETAAAARRLADISARLGLRVG